MRAFTIAVLSTAAGCGAVPHDVIFVEGGVGYGAGAAPQQSGAGPMIAFAAGIGQDVRHDHGESVGLGGTFGAVDRDFDPFVASALASGRIDWTLLAPPADQPLVLRYTLIFDGTFGFAGSLDRGRATQYAFAVTTGPTVALLTERAAGVAFTIGPTGILTLSPGAWIGGQARLRLSVVPF